VTVTASGQAASTNGTKVLVAEGVTVRFGGLMALDAVDLEIHQGTIVGLVGPNGAGKSTLFGVLSGLVRADSGSVLLLGNDVTGASPQARAHLGLARSFQQPELFRSLTVVEHFVLAHRIRHQRSRLWSDLIDGRGWRRADSAELDDVARLIEFLGLESVARRPAESLPTGTARLVEVGRALAAGPKVLLLDEPAAGLDSYESQELSDVLQRVVSMEEVSLLLVEHALDFVLGMSDLVYVLDSGEIIAHGTPTQIREDKRVQTAYLGDLSRAP
jgi:ABC-type branched-subunit amino acid transport system ATPase component